MGFPFHAPLDPLKTYEELSSLSIPFVLKPTLPSNRLLEGTDPTIYVTYSSSVSKMMTEQGNTECYDELVLDGVAEYAFVSPFLSDADPIIFSDVRPGDDSRTDRSRFRGRVRRPAPALAVQLVR